MSTVVGTRVGAAAWAKNGQLGLFGYGVYAGEEVPPGFPFPNPKIVLDDNRGVVWGYQCWWGEEEAFKKRFLGFEVVEEPLPAN